MPTDVTEMADNAARSRYEVTLDGTLAGFAQYRDMDKTRVFTHTEVFPEFSGNGLGSQLIRFALDDVRARGLSLVALCTFVDEFIREHDEYADLVDPKLDVRLRD